MSAREWLKRGRQAIDPFDAFSNYWRGFNGLFSVFPGRSERERIKAFLTAKVPAGEASRILSEISDAVDTLMARPVIDMRKDGRSTAADIAAYAVATTDTQRLESVAMVVYQVRCNLEHGQKSPFGGRDRELASAAGRFVAHVLEFAA